MLAAATDAEGSLTAFTSQQATLLAKATTAFVKLECNTDSKGKLVGGILCSFKLKTTKLPAVVLDQLSLPPTDMEQNITDAAHCMHEIHRLVSLMKEGDLARYEEDLNEACANFG